MLNLNDPTIDLEGNLGRGDLRFIGINGYACFPPGVKREDIESPRKRGVRCLEGTSDAIEGDEHGKLMRQALLYAERYNVGLLQRIR